MMNITIIGPGFVGLTSAVVYAGFGHRVIGIDIDQRKIDLLNQGVVSFYEPKLTEMVADCLKNETLTFTTDYQTGIKNAEIVMICVGTPSDEYGEVDLRFVESCLRSLAPHLKKGAIVVIKSTVPPGTLDWAKGILDQLVTTEYHLASMPEFLREGSAVDDTLNPDRVIIGATDKKVFDKLEELHLPLKAPILKMKPASAQLAKYAANNYLAARITFINEVANVCEKSDADIEEVIAGIGYENRIGKHYWYPGIGYGGSCFPKDVKGLAGYAEKLGLKNNLFSKINELNSSRPEKLMKEIGAKIQDGWKDKKVAILGLSFKPNTDDQRYSPALQILPFLLEQGCVIRSFDPMVTEVADPSVASHPNYQQLPELETAIADAEVIVSLVEWPQIIGHQFKKNKDIAQRYFVDLRNQFDRKQIEAAAMVYFGIGR